MPVPSETTSDGQRVGTVVLGPQETSAHGLPETTQGKALKGRVRITKMLRLEVKGQEGAMQVVWVKEGMWEHLEDSKEINAGPPTRGFRCTV